MADTQRQVIRTALEGFVGRLVRVIVINAVAELREGTPVDTGWARANWIPSVGAPWDQVYGSRPGPGEKAVDGGHSAGLAQVAIYRFGQGPVYITNNVPYIARLNDGWSRQAPAGFVQISIHRAIRATIYALERASA